jgi:transposase
LQDGLIVWLNGGFPGCCHDKAIYDFGKIFEQLAPDERVIADKGYQGAEKCITPHKRRRGNQQLTDQEISHNKTVEEDRWCVERTFSWLKGYYSLSSHWRHPIMLHPTIFSIGCHLVNFRIKNKHLIL